MWGTIEDVVEKAKQMFSFSYLPGDRDGTYNISRKKPKISLEKYD